MTREFVPRGAASTHQLPPTSCGNPASTVVGTSGNSAMRWLAITASTLSLPAFTGPMIPVNVGKATWMSPARRAWTRRAVVEFAAIGAYVIRQFLERSCGDVRSDHREERRVGEEGNRVER